MASRKDEKTENTEMMQTRVSPTVKARAQRIAKERGMSDATYLRSLIIADQERRAPRIAGAEVIG